MIPSAVRDHTLLLVPRQSFLPGNVGSLQNLKKELGMSHILEVRGLQVAFAGERGNTIGTDRIDFFVDQGETVCLVGESGCGKSITSLAVMGLLGRGGRVSQGEILFNGRNLLKMDRKELDQVRGKELSMIFQDPLSSLNPVLTIGKQLEEGLKAHTELGKEERRKRALDLLGRAGIREAEAVMKKYPHQLSGGMRQRVMIAMALSCQPSLLIADEPTTALDVTIQAQIMNLLRSLKRELRMSLLLITHDMGLVAQMADRVMVMYAGQIIEEGTVFEIFDHPSHSYTKALLAAVPSMEQNPEKMLQAIEGTVPENYGQMTGCRFRDRCPYRKQGCEAPQELEEIKAEETQKAQELHRVRCWRAKEAEQSGRTL